MAPVRVIAFRTRSSRPGRTPLLPHELAWLWAGRHRVRHHLKAAIVHCEASA